MHRNWRGVAGLLFTVALMWWLVTKSGVDWANAWQLIRAANPWLLILSSAASTVIFAIRVPRWRLILGDQGKDIAFGDLWESIIIGQMATNILPLRAGEVARAFTISRKYPAVPFSTALGSIAVDRVFDGIAVLLLIAVSMLAPGFPSDAMIGPTPLSRIVSFALAALLVGVAGLFMLATKPTWFISMFDRVARRIAPALADSGAALLARFASGLNVLRSPSRFGLVVLWSLLHWIVCASSYYLAFLAIGIDVPLTAPLFVQGMIVLAVAPPSTPGFVGAFETGAILSLAVYGITRDFAGAFAAVYHAISYVPVTTLGLVYFVRTGLRFSDFKSAQTNA